MSQKADLGRVGEWARDRVPRRGLFQGASVEMFKCGSYDGLGEGCTMKQVQRMSSTY